MILNSYIIQFFIFINVFCYSILASISTLKLVNVVFRHGDRTPMPPMELYPNDPYLHYNFDPPGYGMLTTQGELREYKFGKFLRYIYNDFLGSNYISGLIEARSTYINRTKESLKLVLKALYPDARIPSTFQPKSKDLLLFPFAFPCYKEAYKRAAESSAVKQELKTLGGFMKNLTKWTGKKINNAQDIFLIYTTLETEDFMNLTLPSWTRGIYPDGDLSKGSVFQLNIMSYNDEIKKLNGGKLIRKCIEDMESVRKGSMDKNRKLMLYSAHDLNVSAILKNLGIYFPHVPKFSSAVLLELHFIDQLYYVKVNYYMGIPEEIKGLRIPGCEILCPLDKFINLMENIIPSDSDLSCNKSIEKQIFF